MNYLDLQDVSAFPCVLPGLKQFVELRSILESLHRLGCSYCLKRIDNAGL